MTDCVLKWADAYKKQIYPDGWTKHITTWSTKNPLSKIGSSSNNYRAITYLLMRWINTNGTNRGGNYLFANKLRTVPRGSERMTELDLSNWRTIINWSTNVQGEQNEMKNIAMAWIDNKDAYDMVPQSWIIKCKRYSSKPENLSRIPWKTEEWWR